MTNPAPGRVPQTTGIHTPLSFQKVVWVRLRPTRTRKVKVLWDGTYSISSLSGKTQNSDHLLKSLQRQHFLLSYLKTLCVGPAGVRSLSPWPPAQQTSALRTELTRLRTKSRSRRIPYARHVGSLRTADAFPVVASLPRKVAILRRERSDDRKCVCCS